MRPRISIIGCVRWSVGRLVGWLVTQAFDDPNGAPYWPTGPCYIKGRYNVESTIWIYLLHTTILVASHDDESQGKDKLCLMFVNNVLCCSRIYVVLRSVIVGFIRPITN